MIVAPILLSILGWWATKWPKRVQQIATIVGAVLFTAGFVVALLVYNAQSGQTP
jgi:hypothetical protein